MKQIILILFLFAVSSSCSLKDKKEETKNSINTDYIQFDYSVLSKEQIYFNKLSFEYKNSIEEDTVCGIVKFTLDSANLILHYYNGNAGAFGDGDDNCAEKISIKNKLFSLPISFFQVQSIYDFSFQNKEYLLILIRNRQMIMSGDTNYWILFDIKNEQEYQITNVDDLPYFITDFNEDNKLDYLQRNFNEDTVKLLSLDDKNQFAYLDNNYLIVKNTPNQDSLSTLMEQTAGELIDTKNSKWFSKLRNTQNKNN